MSKKTNLSFLTDYITADITNGRIGINNASPTVAFDVSGATKISGTLTLGGNTLLSYSSSTTTANAYPRLGVSNINATQQDYNISELYVSAGNGTVSGGLVASYSSTYPTSTPSIMLRNSGNGPLYFSVNGTIAQTITSVGNVGIGTTTPAYSFEVKKTGTDSTIWGYNIAQLADGTANATGFRVGTSTSVSGLTNLVAATNNDASQFAFWTYNGSAWGERMRITSAGNVGIGNTNPGVKLEVSGAISASGNINGGSFSMNFGSSFNYGTGFLKSSTNGITVTTSTTTIYTSTNIGGVLSGNLVVVTGVRSGNGVNFVDLILYMNSGSISVISSQVFGSPPSRSYSVSNENLNLSLSSGTYVVACVALIQGYTNP